MSSQNQCTKSSNLMIYRDRTCMTGLFNNECIDLNNILITRAYLTVNNVEYNEIIT